MDARAGISSDPLFYTPFPPDLEGFINRGLQHKFLSGAIIREHEFTARNANGRQKVNCLAFTSDLYHDLDTAAVTIYYDPEHIYNDEFIINRIAYSGAPFAFIGRQTHIFPFGLHTNGKIQALKLAEGHPYDRFPEFCHQFESDINPDRIISVKNGTAIFEAFSQVDAYQLRLFALDVTRRILADTFASAVSVLRSQLTDHTEAEKTTDYAVKLLGAIILAHKGRLGSSCQDPMASFELIYRSAVERFPKYFDFEIDQSNTKAIQSAYHILQQATYSSFTPDMLSELYVRAYQDREHRKREGRFDTPLYLTRLILDSLPIETISPERRLLLDMTCGWGSFLVAGYERLSKMGDMENSPLWRHIVGNDKDPFTAQLARVALLTTSLDDSWQVENQDALSFNFNGMSPSIIVGNPKFFGARSSGDRATVKDKLTGKPRRLQEADQFLIKAVDLLEPGGYLGMVMPASFSIGEANSVARKTLLEQCDILELWNLPNEIFRDQATVKPLAILAQKKTGGAELLNAPVRIRSSLGQSLKVKGVFTSSNVFPSQAAWGKSSVKTSFLNTGVTHVIDFTTILSYREWKAIFDKGERMSDWAEIVPGAIKGTQRRWKDYTSPKEVQWLSDAKKTLPRPFDLQWNGETIIYPNELEEPRKNKLNPAKDREIVFDSPKVLLVADIEMGWGKRARVAIDRFGYYVSSSFCMFVPKHKYLSLEVLAAVLSWDVCNSWIIEKYTYPRIQKRTLDNIPVPKLSENDCRLIEQNMRFIEESASRNEPYDEAQEIIDKILKQAYGLDEQTFKLLRSVMNWEPSHENDIEREVPPSWDKIIRVSGFVQEVNPLVETMTVLFDGIDGIFSFPIDKEVPGWMLRKGAAFTADISYDTFQSGELEDVQWWNIKHKEYTYLNEEELIKRISLELKQD